MNLIEKFENKQFQDVGTFNSIFKSTPILGFSSNTPVEIKQITPAGRRILVGDSEIFLDLNTVQKSKTVKFRAEKEVVVKTKKVINIPSMFKQLSPVELYILNALKHVEGETSVRELSKHCSIGYKTIYANLYKIEKLGYIKTRLSSGNILFLQLTQSNF